MTGTSPPCLSYFHVTHVDFVIVLWFSAQLGHGNRQERTELSIPYRLDSAQTLPLCGLSSFSGRLQWQGPFGLKFLLIFQGFDHLPGTPSKSRCRDPPSGIHQALLTSTSHYLSPHTLPAQKNLLVEIPELPRSLKWGKLKEEGNQCMFQKILLALLLWGVQRKTA